MRTGTAAGKAEDIGLGPFGAPKIHTRVNNGRRNWKASWKGAADERERAGVLAQSNGWKIGERAEPCSRERVRKSKGAQDVNKQASTAEGRCSRVVVFDDLLFRGDVGSGVRYSRCRRSVSFEVW